MDAVVSLVRKAGKRLFVNDLLQALAITTTGAIGAAMVLRVVERTLGLSAWFEAHRWEVIAGLAGAAVVGAVGWASAQRRKQLTIAQVVDARAGTREAMSTALLISRDTSPWSQAVRESAQHTAAKLHAGAIVPYEGPRAWPAPLLGAVALAVVWFAVPKMDLLKKEAQQAAREERIAEVQAVKAELAQDKAKLKQVLAQAKVDVLKEPGANEIADAQKVDENDPESLRRAQVRELTEIKDKLDEQAKSEQAQQVKALQEAMRQLRSPGKGPMDNFSRQLARGNYAGAKEQLEQLMKDFADDNLTDEQKAQAKEQLEQLAKQLKDLAKNEKELVKQLQKQGLDKKTAEQLAKNAGNPEQLKQQLEQLKKDGQISQQAQQEMTKMAQAMNNASQQCNSMSNAMSQAAQGMSQEGLQQSGMEGMEQLGEELSESEMMQSDMEQLGAAMEETSKQLAKLGKKMGSNSQQMNAGQKGQQGEGEQGEGQGGEGQQGQGQGQQGQGQQGQGQGQGQGGQGEGEGQGQGGQSGQGKLGNWSAGNSSNKGNGSGGPGQGNGRGPEGEEADFELEKKKAEIKLQQGPMIGSRLVYGDQVRGESVAEFNEAVSAGERTMTEGIESLRVPREMERAVQQYFGRLKAKAQQAAPVDASKQLPTDTKPPSSGNVK